jgi:hypothetical protein
MSSHQDGSPPPSNEQSLNKSKGLNEFVVKVVKNQHQSVSLSPSTSRHTCEACGFPSQQKNTELVEQQRESSSLLSAEEGQNSRLEGEQKRVVIEVGRLLAKIGDALWSQRHVNP